MNPAGPVAICLYVMVALLVGWACWEARLDLQDQHNAKEAKGSDVGSRNTDSS